ncbi:MAG: outer membrane beta-barrel protein [Neptuniibacter sp.]
MNKQVLSALVLGTTLISAPAAFSYEAGDIIVRVGAANVDPSTTDNTGLGLDVKDDISVGITGTYMLTDNIGVELLAATPFDHDVNLTGVGKVADTKHLPPTLSIQYFPMDNKSKLQPYIGVGINYTTFFSEGSSAALGNAEVELDDSFGLAAQLGVDYAVNENWLVNAAVWKMDIDTDLKIGGVDVGEVEIDPTVFMLSVGYKF